MRIPFCKGRYLRCRCVLYIEWFGYIIGICEEFDISARCMDLYCKEGL